MAAELNNHHRDTLRKTCPRGKDIDKQMIVEVQRMLAGAGFSDGQ